MSDTPVTPDAPVTPAGAPALELRDVVAGYEETTVLRDVSITVPRSKVVGLLGANGAGKSTLLRTVSGVLRPMGGSVWIDGEDVTRTPSFLRSRRGLCHVPEGRAIYRSLSVHDNLVMQARKGEENAAIEQASELFPVLGRRLSQPAGTLSGGEQQMLAMVAAYVRQPTLVLVDEPSLGLAPVIVDTLFELLERLRERDVSLLIVDQFVHRVLDIADHVYVLNQGVIDFDGTPEGLTSSDIFERYLGTAPPDAASNRAPEAMT